MISIALTTTMMKAGMCEEKNTLNVSQLGGVTAATVAGEQKINSILIIHHYSHNEVLRNTFACDNDNGCVRTPTFISYQRQHKEYSLI
jgi:hypothetical protein